MNTIPAVTSSYNNPWSSPESSVQSQAVSDSSVLAPMSPDTARTTAPTSPEIRFERVGVTLRKSTSELTLALKSPSGARTPRSGLQTPRSGLQTPRSGLQLLALPLPIEENDLVARAVALRMAPKAALALTRSAVRAPAKRAVSYAGADAFRPAVSNLDGIEGRGPNEAHVVFVLQRHRQLAERRRARVAFDFAVPYATW